MNDIQELLLKALVKSYFNEELQRDESPGAAKKRLELQKIVVELSNKNS